MNRYPIDMKSGLRLAVVLAMAVGVHTLSSSDVMAQRGRGGGMRGGGGARPSGGMQARPQAATRSPSMSRPAPSAQTRPAARPATGNAGNRAAAGGNRAAAGGNRSSATNRASATGRAGQNANPSRGELTNFLNVSGSGSGGSRAASVSGRAAGGNSAINDFFSHDAAATAQSASASGRTAGSVANQRSENIAGRTDKRTDFRDSRGENRDFASDNRQERVSDRGDRQATRVSTRGETRSTLAAGRGEARSTREQQRIDQADRLREELEDHFDENHLFDDFWKNNPQAYYRFNQNPVFWTWATVGTMSAFMGAGYNSGGGGGGGGETYYEDGTVYAGEEQIPAEEYAQQAEEIVESAPEVENPDDVEWLPLGVFALAQGDGSDSAPNMFLQLAVSKEGIVAGTYQNKTTDKTESVEGMVDKDSQRAAWTIAGKSSPIMETKLANLTENETNVLVHFADGTTQEWLMLHLEKPADEK